MRVTYDPQADMGYIYLVDEIGAGQVERSVTVEDAESVTAVLDYDSRGRLLGVEVFDAGSQLHPAVLDSAERL